MSVCSRHTFQPKSLKFSTNSVFPEEMMVFWASMYSPYTL